MAEQNGNLDGLKTILWSSLSDLGIDNNAKEKMIQSIIHKIQAAVEPKALKEKLNILYEYEKHYLELLKEYKEEIKFAANLQEELRKERTKFFAESLKEVSETLKDAQVDSKVASAWIEDLVESYTRSLDLSSNLIEENTVDMIGELRKETRKASQSVKTSTSVDE